MYKRLSVSRENHIEKGRFLLKAFSVRTAPLIGYTTKGTRKSMDRHSDQSEPIQSNLATDGVSPYDAVGRPP